MAELVDALASGASVLRDVEDQVLSRVPNKGEVMLASLLFGNEKSAGGSSPHGANSRRMLGHRNSDLGSREVGVVLAVQLADASLVSPGVDCQPKRDRVGPSPESLDATGSEHVAVSESILDPQRANVLFVNGAGFGGEEPRVERHSAAFEDDYSDCCCEGRSHDSFSVGYGVT